MRKLLLLTLLVLMFPIVLASPQSEIQIENITPQPSSPGDTVKVHLVAQNQGTTDSTYDPVTVETSEKITLLGRTSLKESFYLCGGCQKVSTFYLKISENAVSGSHPVEFQLASDGTGIVEETVISVDGEPNIVVSIDEVKVGQGENTSFDLSIENTGTDTASDIVVETGGSGISVKPSSATFSSLEPGETEKKTLSLKVDDSLASGIHSLDVSTSYRDEEKRLSTTSTPSFEVMKESDLSVSSLKVRDATIGKETEAIVEVDNLGPGEAENIVSKLSCNGAQVGNGKAFIGQLDNEESVPMVFSLTPQSSKVDCQLDIGYRDSDEKNISEDFTFSANREPFPTVPAAVSVLILGAGLYYWRKNKGNDEEEA